MSPRSSTTLTRLDPGLPLLWRDERTIQIGAIDGERIDADAGWVELLLSRMRVGFRRAAFDVIAHGVGAPRDEARALLARLEPILIDDPPPPPAAWVESLNVVDGRVDYRIREALADEGVLAGERGRPGHIGIVLVQGAAAALQLAGYLRDDLTHLPVSFERSRVTVGPLVIPGETPCLTCRDGQERDRDAAWPRLHAQLIARDPGPISAAQVAEAATIAARILHAPTSPDDESVVGVSANGSLEWRRVRFHEGCRCRVPSCPSLPGTGTAPAPLVRPTATTSGPAFARRA